MPSDKKILICEDEFFLAENIKARLEFMGYKTVLAENGQEALDLLAQDKEVGLILMDAMMPVMDGFEATRQIRANPLIKDIPLLFLTARARPEDRDAALEVGANDYIAKPFEADHLVEMVERYLS